MSPVARFPGCRAPLLGARATVRLAEGYAGACLRVTRAADGAEASIGFDAEGRVDLTAARAFAGTAVLCAGVLRVTAWLDQAGTNHLFGRPGACPSLCSERDAFGGAFPDAGFVMQDGAKDFYPRPLSRALRHAAGFRPDLADAAAFLVARPTVSVSGNAWLTLGDARNGAFLSLFTAERSGSTPGGLTLAAGKGSEDERWNGIGDITTVPRVNRHCLGLVSRRNGITIFSENRMLPPVAPVAGGIVPAGSGGIGATVTSGFHATNDLYASLDFSGSITDGEAQAVMRALSTAFGTGLRKNRLVADGSSTPRGQGAEANLCYPKLMQGGLDREIDVFNIAVNGYTVDDMIANCPVRVLPLIEAGVNCIYCPDGLSNGLARGDTAEAVYAKLKGLCRTVKTVGARVVAATAKNRGDLGVGGQSERAKLNRMLRANWRGELGADALLDVDAIPETADPGDTRYFQPDRVHNRNPVHVLIAGLAASAVQPLLV